MGRRTEQPASVAPSQRETERRLEVRWTTTVSRWSDPFGACVEGHSAGQAALILELELPGAGELGDRTGTSARAWIETANGRRPVLDDATVECRVEQDDELTHVDVVRDGLMLAVLTLNGNARVLYARTPLLAAAGMSAGRIDPPTVNWR